MQDLSNEGVQRRLQALAESDVVEQAAGRAGEDPLARIARLAVALINPCRSAGITVTSEDAVSTAASSDDVARRGDELQSELKEGPCLDAAERDVVIHVDDLRQEQRWSRWSPRATAELGIRSMLCLPLYSDHTRSGALNLYAAKPGAFGADDFAVAQALASNSALAAAAAQKITQLENALDTRTTIGQATGLVMATCALDEHAAFALLTKLSQDGNEKLVRIASRLVQQHNAGERL